MKSLFNRLSGTFVVALLIIAAIVKIGWFVVETGWLRFVDTDYIAKATAKPLYYTSHLASSVPPTVTRPKPQAKPQPSNEIRQMKLLSVYHSEDNDVVTVLYKGKSKVIARGESVGGYTLQSGGIDFAVFERNGKRHTLRIQKEKTKSIMDRYIAKPVSTDTNATKPSETDEEIIADGNKRMIPREVLDRYTHDLKSIYRNIGINEVRKNGKTEGFKVTFVRRGSVFAKLGLKRGDILTAINGRPLDGLKAAFDAYRNIHDATDVTLQVKRGNQTMELEYEID